VRVVWQAALFAEEFEQAAQQSVAGLGSAGACVRGLSFYGVPVSRCTNHILTILLLMLLRKQNYYSQDIF